MMQITHCTGHDDDDDDGEDDDDDEDDEVYHPLHRPVLALLAE